MIKHVVIACAAAVVSSVPVFAQETDFISSLGNTAAKRVAFQTSARILEPGDTAPGARVVTLAVGLCEVDRQIIIDWGSKSRGYGAVSVARLPEGVTDDCSVYNPNLKAGTVDGFASVDEADVAAFEACEAARLPGYDTCVLVGRARDQGAK